jgi:S-DNA-T family DNA segregation ATPase FtsK/SpoIIIE
MDFSTVDTSKFNEVQRQLWEMHFGKSRSPKATQEPQRSPFAGIQLAQARSPQAQHPITQALADIGINAEWIGQKESPSFIRHLIKPCAGVKVATILKAVEDLQMALTLDVPPLVCVKHGAIAIDLPRQDRQAAMFSDFWQPSKKLEGAIGVNIDGKLIKVDLRNPDTCHFLVGGMTGSGKSVWLQSFYLSLALAHSPDMFQAIICDPKRVSFPMMRESAHLRMPIIYDAEKAEPVLADLINIMEYRYGLLEQSNCQDIAEYSKKTGNSEPTILFICDEFADLLDAAEDRKGCESKLVRLAQKARAAGINLCLGTQRPDKDVVTPRLRSNLVVRIALRVKSIQDSDIILGGGDKSINATSLLGKGDLYYEGDRLQALLPTESDFAMLPKKALAIAPATIDIESEAVSDDIESELIQVLSRLSQNKGWLTASTVKQFSRQFKNVSTDQIRQMFAYMAANGIGKTQKADSALEWSI